MADETVTDTENTPAATQEPADDTTAAPAADTTAQPSGDEAALAALDKGIEESSGAPPAPAQAKTEAAADDTGAAEAATTDKPVADATKPKDPADAKAPAKPEPDAEIEAEIKALQIRNEKTATRFRSMASEIKAFAPIKEALDKAGIKDAATFQQAMPQLIQRSKDFEDLVGMVSETGATPEMYTAMLDYMRDATAAANGDVVAAQRSYDRTLKELAVWGKLLGKEVPGVVDPLDAHPDLKTEVENGDLTRPRALEIAQQRSAANLHNGRLARDQQAAAAQTAQANGRTALNTLEAKLKGADPDYLRKREFFLPVVRRIVARFPPEQWAAEAEAAYAEIPALPAAPAPSNDRPPPGPVRGGARMAVAPVPKDAMEALEMGIAAAGGG